MDYEPLLLGDACNAGTDVLGSDADQAPVGRSQLRGIPFQIGSGTEGDRPFVLLKGGDAPVRVPVGRPATWVLFAHRLLHTDLDKGGPVGLDVAQYVFHLADGSTHRVAIRERFEIAAITRSPSMDYGMLPFLAWRDAGAQPYPRYEGPWAQAGVRQVEAAIGSPRGYFLWAWRNPSPEAAVAEVRLVPSGPRFIVAAMTLSQLDEDPFRQEPASEVMYVLPEKKDAKQPFNLDVHVDRGIATYTFPLPTAAIEEYLQDPMRGWGEQRNEQSSPSYNRVAAVPSATLTVTLAGEELGQARWAELRERGSIAPTERLRIELVDRGRNWVKTTIVDDATGEPIPCRLHFRSPEGIPYQPHGHHHHVNFDHESWNVDVGGDVRLGQITYAYVDGQCEGWLPRGDVLVDVARGFEYEPLRTRVRIDPGQQTLDLRLQRWTDMRARRWFSGDPHVHFMSTQGAAFESRGEDVAVTSLLLTQLGSLFTNAEEFTGAPFVSRDGNTIVWAAQENRQHFLGHLSLLGLKRPVMPWCSDGLNEAEPGGSLETTLSAWADECHAQGGTVIIPHHPMPNGEPAALIATGRADAVEMDFFEELRHIEYYRYLNGGYRLPLAGGTDKMSSEVTIGQIRTYVYIPPEEEFSYPTWCHNLSLGRTFLSSGPIIQLEVEGRLPGEELQLPANGGTVEAHAWAESTIPVHTLQLIANGQVIAEVNATSSAGVRRLEIRERLTVDRHTWLAARVGGPGYHNVSAHRDVWRRGVFAHTSPIYVAVGGGYGKGDISTFQYMLTTLTGNIEYIRHMSSQYRSNDVTHRHGREDHMAYLIGPIQEAMEAVQRRMRDMGLAH